MVPTGLCTIQIEYLSAIKETIDDQLRPRQTTFRFVNMCRVCKVNSRTVLIILRFRDKAQLIVGIRKPIPADVFHAFGQLLKCLFPVVRLRAQLEYHRLDAFHFDGFCHRRGHIGNTLVFHQIELIEH